MVCPSRRECSQFMPDCPSAVTMRFHLSIQRFSSVPSSPYSTFRSIPSAPRPLTWSRQSTSSASSTCFNTCASAGDWLNTVCLTVSQGCLSPHVKAPTLVRRHADASSFEACVWMAASCFSMSSRDATPLPCSYSGTLYSCPRHMATMCCFGLSMWHSMTSGSPPQVATLADECTHGSCRMSKGPPRVMAGGSAPVLTAAKWARHPLTRRAPAAGPLTSTPST
mmetsp:Transcript_88805/g.171975  ORF Transcript_88805/g.171975 Transcript_88805/m.171975 type:complete len:223 (+) Transcript_88805:1103-1771(+)